jgi:hypothetical protein
LCVLPPPRTPSTFSSAYVPPAGTSESPKPDRSSCCIGAVSSAWCGHTDGHMVCGLASSIRTGPGFSCYNLWRNDSESMSRQHGSRSSTPGRAALLLVTRTTPCVRCWLVGGLARAIVVVGIYLFLGQIDVLYSDTLRQSARSSGWDPDFEMCVDLRVCVRERGVTRGPQ